MIITKTPFRISFFGGGTDYPAWSERHGGSILATTIDKYCYISCRYLPPFFEHKHRIIYSKMEHVTSVEEIQHKAVREVLKFLAIDKGVEIHHDGDLPARTGLGSSSAFTVGLLHAVYALKGQMVDKMQLARDAIHIERDRNNENVGSQDQVLAAWGGFNRLDFEKNQDIRVQRVPLSQEKLNYLQSSLLLYFTGFTRTASEVAEEQIRNIPNKTKEMQRMVQFVDEAVRILNGKDLNDFGRLLDEAWKTKRQLSDRITTPHVDEIYEAAMRAGALGGKLLGAGGGGFMIFFVEPEVQPKFKTQLDKLLCVPFRFEDIGSQIIVYQPNGS